MTTTKQMIVNAFTKAFNKHFYNELVIGKLAHSEMKQQLFLPVKLKQIEAKHFTLNYPKWKNK